MKMEKILKYMIFLHFMQRAVLPYIYLMKILMIGDAIYPRDGTYYNLSIINNQIEFLNQIDINYILISHKKQFVYRKDVIINFLLNLKKSFLKGENVKEVLYGKY